MVIQNVTSNLRECVSGVNRAYRGLWRTYRNTQDRAVTVVVRNGRSVVHTEVGAAKNIYTSAWAAFERARADGIRATMRNPSRYVPAGRRQMVAAYRATLDLLGKTRGELSEVVAGGYRQMSEQLAAAPAPTEVVRQSIRETGEAIETAADVDPSGDESSDKSSTTAKTPRKKAARRATSTTGNAPRKKNATSQTKTSTVTDS